MFIYITVQLNVNNDIEYAVRSCVIPFYASEDGPSLQTAG